MALDDFRRTLSGVQDLDLPKIEGVIEEMVLWLELLDPTSRVEAKRRLDAEIRDPNRCSMR
jgi:hypothetical protein